MPDDAREDDRWYEAREGAFPGHSVEGADELVQRLEVLSEPLRDEDDLDYLLDAMGEPRLVLLGEASHGTHEYYAWRRRITLRLLQDHGYDFVAVEGDWPACEAVDRYVKSHPDAAGSATEALQAFERWPTWMWRNREVAALADDLLDLNTGERRDRKVGFYGLDVYSLWESLDAVMDYLASHRPSAVDAAREAIGCFDPVGMDEQAYAERTLLVPEDCEAEVVELLTALRRDAGGDGGREASFSAEQNALVAVGAEAYYRTMARGGADSWNLRDTHMMDTLDRLLQHHGPESKGIVWAHNTHVGDARATDMHAAGMVNLGELARERYGSDGVFIVGFGGYEGRVIAGASWGAPMQRMPVPPARAGSVEDLLHRGHGGDRILLFQDPSEWGDLYEARDHRAIGVVYRPRNDRHGNYVPTVLPERYDAFLYFDRTHALEPLGGEVHVEETPETYPSGY